MMIINNVDDDDDDYILSRTPVHFKLLTLHAQVAYRDFLIFS